MKKIVISRKAQDKINYYVQKAKFEISGFGDVVIIDGIPTVTDIILIEQINDPTETEMDAGAIAKAIYHHHISETMTGELKFWWHSHVDMGVFWSKQDKETIEQLTENGWWIHGVFNKKGEVRLAYSNNEPVKVFLDNLELEINEEMVSDEMYELLIQMDILMKDVEEDCDKKFAELVTDKPFEPMYAGSYTGWKDKYKKDVPKSIPHIAGQNIIDDFSDYDDLLLMGYTDDEVLILNTSLNVYSREDLFEYESIWGNIDLELDEILKFADITEKYAK